MKQSKRRVGDEKTKFLKLWKKNTNIPFDEQLFIRKSLEIYRNAVNINKYRLLRKYVHQRIFRMCMESYQKMKMGKKFDEKTKFLRLWKKNTNNPFDE